jgi:hypothetical protein
MADSTRYRVVDFIGGRILEAREMMTLQNIAEGVDPTGDILVQDLNAIYREGATLNVQALIGSGTTDVVLEKIDIALPMQVFVHGRWETLRSTDAPTVTLAPGQTNLYLNWALNVITSVQDASLVDATTGLPTANMGELDYAVSATDTSSAALLSTQLAKNTEPIVLFSFAASGTTLVPVPIDNVNYQALATATSSGLVRLSTGTSSGEAASSDDARLSDARAPLAGSVVDASVRTPVATIGVTNTDGSPQYDLTVDPGGIGADKIIVRSMKERVSDVIANMYAAVAAVVAALAGHIGIGLGSPATHPMPTYSQVGAAPLSHITLPLGVTGSHPPQVNADSGGFEVNQATISATPNDPAYGVFLSGTLLAALTHEGDLYTTLLNALVASPGGSPLVFTGGPLTGLASVAQVLVDHVNQTTGTTNPHGTSLSTLGVKGGQVTFTGHTYGHSEMHTETFTLPFTAASTAVVVVSSVNPLGIDFTITGQISGDILTLNMLNSSFTYGYTLVDHVINYRVL